MTAAEKTAFINDVRAAAQMILNGLAKLNYRKEQWDKLAMSSAGTANQLQDSDFTGVNEGLAVADIVGVLTTKDAINGASGLWASGHGTNLYKVSTE
jgi:hypothetical protein